MQNFKASKIGMTAKEAAAWIEEQAAPRVSFVVSIRYPDHSAAVSPLTEDGKGALSWLALSTRNHTLPCSVKAAAWQF